MMKHISSKKRKFLKTHPWLNDFTVNTETLPHQIWLLLGEAQSKCEHIAGVPLNPELAQQLYRVYLAKGALATTAIEGNTLTEDDAIRELDGLLELPPSKEYLGTEIANIVSAYKQIRDEIFSGKFRFNVNKLKNFNKEILANLPLKDDVIPGLIREYSIGVGTYRAVPAEDCEYLLKEFCKWLNQSLEMIEKNENKIVYSIIISIASHLYFVWIHPFGDGNGRTARLIELSILLNANIPAPASHLLSNHYNETRTEYYRQLDLAGNTRGQKNDFLKYAVQGFVDQLKIQINFIKNFQWKISWEGYIHDLFKNKIKLPEIRQRQLSIDLSRHGEEIEISKLHLITPRIAVQYANKQRRTILRDIDILKKMKLVRDGDKPGTVFTNKEFILAFLPPRKSDNKT